MVLKKKDTTFSWIIRMTLGTFVMAFLFGVLTQTIFQRDIKLVTALLILFVVVFIGVIFDTIGTAAAAATISPLNAKAARRVEGARKGVELVRNADRVANFCNDVVGDITGIISGGIAAVIVYRLIAHTEGADLYLRIILTALVAAVTVGGKAWGKYFALRRSTEIILKIGLILTRFEKLQARTRLRKTNIKDRIKKKK